MNRRTLTSRSPPTLRASARRAGERQRWARGERVRWGPEAFRRRRLLDFQGLGVRGLGVKYVFAIAKVWGDGAGRAICHFPGGAVGGLGGCVAGKLTMKIELPIFDFRGIMIP